ncbi:MAG TPA: hypothetical protein DCZ71_08580 [Ruminococcus sp.]|nr:hypothetical protein [Ruminococcus sp.]
MDNFAEQIVKKDIGSGARARSIALFITGFLLAAAIALISLLLIPSPLLSLFGLILAAACGAGTVYMVQGMQIEYEYTFTNGELDIDKIIAKKRRREMLTVNVRAFTDFGIYSEQAEESPDMTVVIASGVPAALPGEDGSEPAALQDYYADFQHENYGITRLIFTPDERMLGNIRRALPGALRNKLN